MRALLRTATGLFVLASWAALAGVTSLSCRLPEQPPPGAPGPVIFEKQLCDRCHGTRGEGTRLGPPFGDLAAKWTREELAEFLGDVERFEASDERIRALAAEYPGNMGSYANLSLEERLRLADHLLGGP